MRYGLEEYYSSHTEIREKDIEEKGSAGRNQAKSG